MPYHNRDLGGAQFHRDYQTHAPVDEVSIYSPFTETFNRVRLDQQNMFGPRPVPPPPQSADHDEDFGIAHVTGHPDYNIL